MRLERPGHCPCQPFHPRQIQRTFSLVTVFLSPPPRCGCACARQLAGRLCTSLPCFCPQHPLSCELSELRKPQPDLKLSFEKAMRSRSSSSPLGFFLAILGWWQVAPSRCSQRYTEITAVFSRFLPLRRGRIQACWFPVAFAN
jgi:hypothetical protein